MKSKKSTLLWGKQAVEEVADPFDEVLILFEGEESGIIVVAMDFVVASGIIVVAMDSVVAKMHKYIGKSITLKCDLDIKEFSNI